MKDGVTEYKDTIDGMRPVLERFIPPWGEVKIMGEKLNKKIAFNCFVSCDTRGKQYGSWIGISHEDIFNKETVKITFKFALNIANKVYEELCSPGNKESLTVSESQWLSHYKSQELLLLADKTKETAKSKK